MTRWHALVLVVGACRSEAHDAAPRAAPDGPLASPTGTSGSEATPDSTRPPEGALAPAPSLPAAAATSQPFPAAPTCPDGMLPIKGGSYWAGATTPGGTGDEQPRHRTNVHDYCLDRTEVTAEAYDACVASGECTSAARDTRTCNPGKGRPRHPANCVSWEQAEAFCRARGARLPTELEWEYAARGGSEMRTYSWGNDPPDGNTCWKHSGTCEVATHREGAFGLHDMNGNLWEWTATWYAPYPWPATTGYAKIYRGGGWSRRFEKWLSLSLRNRQAPHEFGSHLGFRCAALASPAACPYGREGEACRHGVETAECAKNERWNGVRCAPPGEQGCRAGQELIDGHGCSGGGGFPARKTAEDSAPATPVTARPDARYHADCQRFQPSRPKAVLFEGGTHAARTAAGNARGCKNRDVGVGWNSSCCP